MRCTQPRTVGWKACGTKITFSPKELAREFATFQLPCGKCISCRLEYARQWSIRCMHEAQMYERNSFVTLTYTDENLKSPKLEYRDFQLFMKRLRKTQNKKISLFVTGEYGDTTKRPHWHALIFGWRPLDTVYEYSNDNGDKVFTSKTLDTLWGLGGTKLGQITRESANYCARYSAKKLVHGNDQDHEFQPISKKSSKYAIGKKWLETYWRDAFNYGSIVLPDGTSSSIPRYYEKWLQTHHPDEYMKYFFDVKLKKTEFAQNRSREEIEQELKINEIRRRSNSPEKQIGVPQISKNKVRATIIKRNLNILNQFNKL